MFDAIRKLFTKHILYIKILPDRIFVHEIYSGIVVEDRPEIAIYDKEKRVLAVGHEVDYAKENMPELRIVHGFPVTDPIRYTEENEAMMRYFVLKALGNGVLFKPAMIFQMLGREGDLKTDEIKALEKIGEHAGAGTVYIWQGEELTADQILNNDELNGRPANPVMESAKNALKYLIAGMMLIFAVDFFKTEALVPAGLGIMNLWTASIAWSCYKNNRSFTNNFKENNSLGTKTVNFSFALVLSFISLGCLMYVSWVIFFALLNM